MNYIFYIFRCKPLILYSLFEQSGCVSGQKTLMMDSPLLRTIDEAAGQIIEEMFFDETVKVSILFKEELAPIKLALRVSVQNRLKGSGINEELRGSWGALSIGALEQINTFLGDLKSGQWIYIGDV